MASAVPPITVVGKGRVGQALKDMGAGEDVLIGRGEPVAGPDGPIVVCTRNNDLQGAAPITGGFRHAPGISSSPEVINASDITP